MGASQSWLTVAVLLATENCLVIRIFGVEKHLSFLTSKIVKLSLHSNMQVRQHFLLLHRKRQSSVYYCVFYFGSIFYNLALFFRSLSLFAHLVKPSCGAYVVTNFCFQFCAKSILILAGRFTSFSFRILNSSYFPLQVMKCGYLLQPQKPVLITVL